MKLINSFWLGQTTGETIATFGAARLVKKLDGKIELIGGTADDHAAAGNGSSAACGNAESCRNSEGGIATGHGNPAYHGFGKESGAGASGVHGTKRIGPGTGLASFHSDKIAPLKSTQFSLISLMYS